MEASTDEETFLKRLSLTRKPLEPIKEEIQGPILETKSQSKKSLIHYDSPTKPCPATQGECPTKAALQRFLVPSTRNSMTSDWSSMYDGSRRSYSSILERPFIFRRASSLQRAVLTNEMKMAELYISDVNAEVEEEVTSPSPCTSSATVATDTGRFTDTKSQTDFTDSGSSCGSAKRKLQYLMGISGGGEDEGQPERDQIEKVIVDEKEPIAGETEAMKHAQRYLRIHRIFEFYQFLVAHLLSALPENPINFLLDLFDKCIIYRAGMGTPPLLYDRKHLTALFNLMDRMRTGYIDKDQYVTGMKTLGICCYNVDPPLTDGMVHKDFFVEEAYDCLVSMLNDIIRRRWIYFNSQPPPVKTPPPTPQYSACSGRTNASKP